MIGIVILGLGLVLVATIFPVAWSRARTLSEYTTQKAVADGAHATVKSLVRVSSPTSEDFPSDKDASSFQGELFHDRLNNVLVTACPDWTCPPPPAGLLNATDTWVHALNLENIQVQDRRFVSEDLWETQAPGGVNNPLRQTSDPVFGNWTGTAFVEGSFFRAQLSFHQRVYPPMGPRANVSADGEFVDPDDRWDDALNTRRFCWAMFHQLRDLITVDPVDPSAPCVPKATDIDDAKGLTRSFDVYYVTLRRPQPTYRYARQESDPDLDPPVVSNPCDLTWPPVVPTAMPPENDVMFPVPWRVQVQFPDNPPLRVRADATGIPTEIVVPPPTIVAEDARQAMLVQMFPRGARFIDEITGQVYRVVKRRVTGDNAEQAFLTLDREVFIKDVDLPDLPGDIPDPRCDNPVGVVSPCEQLRTVWVFPPAVVARTGDGDILTFVGSQPVVDIEVRRLHIPPSG